MGQFVSRRLMLAIASGIGLWLAAANGLSLADDDRSTTPAGSKSRIAIPEFAVSNPRAGDIAVRIRQAIIDRFSHLESYAFSDATDATTSIDAYRVIPEFSAWQARNVQFLIVSRVDIGNDGRLKVTAWVWNVPDRREVTGQQVIGRIEKWQQAADFLADEFIRHLTDQEMPTPIRNGR